EEEPDLAAARTGAASVVGRGRLPPAGVARMIRIIHLSGSQQGKTATSAKSMLRVGRAADCDVRFDKERDPKVSNHHAEFLFEDGCWFVVDTASTNGTLVEGRRIAKHRLRQGEEVQFGKGGPLLRVEFDAQEGLGGAMKTE